ncbi:MAG: hypothetical protein AB8H79_00600 [Myxococcota bacterium]
MHFHLNLDERREDRVFLTVCLSPDHEPVAIEGVAVELRCAEGNPLGPRLVLPISGPLASALALRTELRSRDMLPRGARAVGIAWTDCGRTEASCPCDPGTALENFARGSRIGLADLDEERMRDLSTTEHSALVRAFPWMAHFRPDTAAIEGQILDEQPDDIVDDVAGCYGLCDEDKELLRELLGEDDDSMEAGAAVH